MKFKLSFALLFCGMAWAQQAASVSGKLQDPNGNPVTGTEGAVHMVNTATQKEFTTPITDKGEYTLNGLSAGIYNLTVPMACCMYGTYSQKGVTVAVGQALKLDLHLPWNINLGTIGDDPVMLMNDMRAKAKNIDGPTPRMPDGKVDFSGMWAQVTDPRSPIQDPPIHNKFSASRHRQRARPV